MRKLVVALVVATSLAIPGGAQAYWDHPTYPNYMWWTPSQPATGPCTFFYSGRGYACSGWNYFWKLGGYFTGLHGFTCPGSGRMYTAWQNDSAIRGSIWNNGHSPCNSWETYIGAEIVPWQYFAYCGSTCYIKASQYYWDGTSTVARVLGYT